MDMKPEISVIIYGIQYARHLERCLHSILMQTVQNIELIAVIDHTLEAEMQNRLKQLAGSDHRLRFVEGLRENGSRIPAQAIEACGGRYILIASADLFYPYDAFQTMLEKADESGLIFNIVYKSQEEGYCKANHSWDSVTDLFLEPSLYQHLFAARILKSNPISLHTKGRYQILESLIAYYTYAEPNAMTDEVLAYCGHARDQLLVAENAIDTPYMVRIARQQIEKQHLNTAFLTIGSLLAMLNTEVCTSQSREWREEAFQCLRSIADVSRQDQQLSAYLQLVLKMDARLLCSMTSDLYFDVLRTPSDIQEMQSHADYVEQTENEA